MTDQSDQAQNQDQEEVASPERRDFFKTAAAIGAVGAVAAGVAGKFGMAPVSTAQAQTQQQWWPSRWGAGDEAGATNWITPQKVLDAVRLIKSGKIYKLGREYEPGMPLFGTRAFTLRIPGAPTGGPFGTNKVIYNDEYLATEIGQVGTQFDGLGHIGIQLGPDGDKNQMRFYNGFTAQEIIDSTGLKKLGTEKLKPIFTRAYLVDVVPLKGRMWDAGEEITAANIVAALSRVGIAERDVKEGDVLAFHTGWGQLWMKNNDKYNSGCPGIGMDAAKWIVSKGITVVAADTWPVEAVPNPDPNLGFPVHGELITKNGILINENLKFDDLLKDNVYQFVYSFTPSPIKGATGSNGCPIAIA